MSDILVGHAGEQRGPFTEAEVLRMVQAGEFSRTDLWWREGMANWEPLSTLLPAQGPPPIPDQLPATLPPPLPSNFPPPSRPVPARSVSPLVIVLCVVGGVVALIFVIAVVAAIAIPNIAMKSRKAGSHGREAVGTVSADASSGSSSPSASVPAAAKSVSTEGWHENSLEVLKFKTPFALKPTDVQEETEEANKLVVSSRALEGEDDDLYVIASVVTYSADAQVLLDGAVKGAMEGMASSLGVPVPEYQAVKTTVDGLPARQVDAAMDVKMFGVTGRFRTRALFVQSGQRLAQLLVIQFEPGEDVAARARAVVESVSVAGPAGG